jgi:hypothetical protein
MQTALLNQIHIKLSPVKRLTHLIPVGQFCIQTISGHVDKVVFAAESHVKNQNMQYKFLSGFGGFANLCYYCSDKAFSFIEKHHGLRFSTTTKQMLFSFVFSPSGEFLRTGDC